MRIFLAGHDNFGNRGCEALVRSITALVRERIPDAEFLCPSRMPAADAAQWPEAAAYGISFVPHVPMPPVLRWWGRAHRAVPAIRRCKAPAAPLDRSTAAALESADVVALIGGDVLGLEYGLPSLFQWTNLMDSAVRRNKRTVLWAASVGPFSSDPVVERQMIRHLRRYAAITVRETSTLHYLRGLGLSNVALVADPAFTLAPQPFDCEDLIFGGHPRVLGLNVSPLIRQFRTGLNSAEGLDAEVVRFIRTVIADTSYRILLIPHVHPQDGGVTNSDSAYLRDLLARAGGSSSRLRLAPSTLNAAQLKHLIGRCQHFIGARTHATIAALSSAVPTISIAYSAKAKGINQDIFGDTRYVLETSQVSARRLLTALNRLSIDDAEIRNLLSRRRESWRRAAAAATASLEPSAAGEWKGSEFCALVR